MKKAVITLCVGDAYEKISKLTHPTIEAYAKKIGAIFIVIRDRIYGDEIPTGYEKLRLKNYLEEYDRIIYVDTDLIIRPDTPNLFEFLPEGMFCAFNEGAWIPDRLKSLGQAVKEFGLSTPEFKNQYYNTGVMVFEKKHSKLFIEPPAFINHFYEQSFLNIMIARERPEIRELPHIYNRMSHFDQIKGTVDYRHENYIIHYAGNIVNYGLDETLKLIENDLKEWGRLSANNYHIRKVIKVSIGGGLGDQIETEPVVREVRRLYPHDRIIVASHWPELFQDLPYEVESVNIQKHFIPEEIYAMFHTYSPPDDEAWKYMTHVFSHSTDFSSQLAIRRVLPPEKKQIMIKYTPKHLINLYAKLEILPGYLDKAVCIHPGRSWRTKTLSSDFWNEIIEQCVKNGYKTIVFGKDGKDTQGLTEVNIPEGVIDARNKLSIKESLALLDKSHILVSNDSAPIHLAGATDIWIIGIFTAKHPAFVWPFRNGRQDYKTIEVNNRPSCWPCNVNAVTTCLDEIRADYCLNLNNKFSCYPISNTVFENIRMVSL